MTTGKILPIRLDNIGDIVFGEDHVVFYSETDSQNRPYKVVKLDVDSGDSECIFVDERLSSRAAGDRFAELRASGGLKRKHASKLDAMAAQIILENWLQSLPVQQAQTT